VRLLRDEDIRQSKGRCVCALSLGNRIRTSRHLLSVFNRPRENFSRKAAPQMEHQCLSDEQHGFRRERRHPRLCMGDRRPDLLDPNYRRENGRAIRRTGRGKGPKASAARCERQRRSPAHLDRRYRLAEGRLTGLPTLRSGRSPVYRDQNASRHPHLEFCGCRAYAGQHLLNPILRFAKYNSDLVLRLVLRVQSKPLHRTRFVEYPHRGDHSQRAENSSHELHRCFSNPHAAGCC